MNSVLRNKGFKILYATVLSVLVMLLLTVHAKAASVKVSVTGKYHQSEARATLSSINKFRQSSDAWYWNSDDKTKTVQKNLKALTYDYTLEKIAMQRAAEIAVFYSHTRPDGSSTFSLVIDGVSSDGENIAITSADKDSSWALKEWREDNDKYAGQGHRRLILDEEYTAVGVAHLEFRGVHLFVQEFGRKSTGKSDPGVCNTTKTMNVSIDSSKLKIGASLKYTGFTVTSGWTEDLPEVTVGLKPVGSYADNICPGVEVSTSDYSVEWSSGNSKVVRISGSQYIAESPGETTLTATVTYKKDGSKTTTSMKLKVTAMDLSGLKFGSIPDMTYYGKPVTIPFTITYNGETLKEGVDYTLTFKDNDKPGTATYIIEGIGKYTGKSTGTFKIVGSGGSVAATNTPTPKPTATVTPKTNNTATPTPKAATPTPKATATPTPKAATPTPKATTPTPKATATPTPKPVNTVTPTPKATVTPTPKPVNTVTPTPKETATPTPKPTSTATPTPKATVTPTPNPTSTATPTPKATVTPTPIVTNTLTPTPKATPSPDPTNTATPTPMPTGTIAPTPDQTPTESPTPEPTGIPTEAGTPTPGAGTPTPDAGEVTPGEGTPTPDAGEVTPGAGTPTPDAGEVTPGTGTPTPDAGEVAPGAGTPTPDAGDVNPGEGTPTPGAETPTVTDTPVTTATNTPTITTEPSPTTSAIGTDAPAPGDRAASEAQAGERYEGDETDSSAELWRIIAIVACASTFVLLLVVIFQRRDKDSEQQE